MTLYFFYFCTIICYFSAHASSSEDTHIESTTDTIVSKNQPKILEKKNEKINNNENNQNQIDFLAHINKHIAPLEADFKNYVVPVCAKISSTAAVVISVVNQIGDANNNIIIPQWLQTLTNGLTFVANIAWLIQHVGDKKQVTLFLNKTNNAVGTE